MMTDILEQIANNKNAGYYQDCAEKYTGSGGIAARIIDSHCHIYPKGIAPKAVRAIDRFYENLPPCHRDGTTDTLLLEAREQNIAHFIVHSVATTPEQVSSINTFIADSVRKSGGLFTGMGTLHPDSGTTESDLEDICRLGLKGVKLHPDIQRFDADNPWAMKVYEICESRGLPICVHTGDFRYDYSNPPRIARILRAFPNLKFIGAHFGGWSVWEEAASLLSGFRNLIVDTSSSFNWLSPETAVKVIRSYGSDRVMFGTDYPMFTRQPELEYLRRLSLTREEYADICWRTCSRLFDLDFS